ncbi:reverse transcriptase domain-containing protein [Tanacetum coccineum]
MFALERVQSFAHDKSKRTTRSTRVPPVTPAPTTTTVTEAQLQALIDQGVAAAMAEAEASRVRNCYNNNGSRPRPAQTARECSYSEFLKCKPLDFKGTEGVVELTRWFEKIESVFSISNCPAASQVKFTTCTLQDDALTWWNSHVKTTTPKAAHAMPWAALKKMMTDKYCPRGEIKKIETEMWNLKVKGTDVVAYSRRFQQLALMCSRMFPEEIDKIEKYIGGLPDMIHGSVKASKLVAEIKTNNNRIRPMPMLNVRQKRKEGMMIFPRTIKTNNSRIRARTHARPTLHEIVTGNLTPGLNLYVLSVVTIMKVLVHLGAITAKRLAIWLRIVEADLQMLTTTTATTTTAKGNGCYECRAQGHFKRNCPKLRNNDRGNQSGNDRAPTKVYVVGNAGANPDNVVVD